MKTRDYSHPECQIPSCFRRGLQTHRSPPVSFSGLVRSDILTSGLCSGINSSHPGTSTINNGRTPRLWAQAEHITDIYPHTTLLIPRTFSNDRMAEAGHPSAQHDRTLR